MDETGSVSRTISPNDTMFEAGFRNLDGYLRVGREPVDLLKRFCQSPRRIFDFGCGHGRVLRHIVVEWPEAEAFACDLDPDAVKFCQREFGVHGIVSTEDPKDLTIPRFDLIWVGSVFTHLEPYAWRGFLGLLAKSLDGVLGMSLEGPFVAQRVREGEEMGVGERAASQLAEFDETGFAFRDYVNGRRKGYGFVLCSPERARIELEAVGLKLLAYEPQGWMGRQDVVVAVPA